MILAILAAAVLSAALSSWLTVALRPARPMPRAARRLLDDAATLLARISNPTDLDRLDVLSDRSQAAVARWLTRYDKENPQ